MPRLDHRVASQQRLTPRERALVLLMRELVNDVRTQAGLGPVSEAEMEHRLWEMVRNTLNKDRG
jgi:hypothetical protein